MASPPPPPSWSKLLIAVGTYDGALAGWEYQLPSPTKGKHVEATSSKNNNNKMNQRLTLTFATACHDGSVRSLCFASPTLNNHHNSIPTDDDATTNPSTLLPGSLLSCGFDEMLRTHDWSKRMTGLGEVRTPTDFGTPLCASFAPPSPPPLSSGSSILVNNSTHALVGFSQGKLVIYRKRDWSVQHVLAGHDGGVGCLAVHPSGKLALSGGQSDGKLKLWDLTKGRLAYATQVVVVAAAANTPGSRQSQQQQQQHRNRRPVAINSLVWSPDGTAYGFCHGKHITVRHVDSGKDLLDVDDMPSRVNQITLLSVEEGLFVAAACDDGSLPVLAVQLTTRNWGDDKADDDDHDDEDDASRTRRAIMAIEPVDAAVAGEERFKCIQVVSDYHVVTANSAGVVSLMSLQGAIQMIIKADDDDNDDNEENKDQNDQLQETDNDDEDDVNKDDEEEELAVEIIDSVQLGQGTRITCLAVWAQPADEMEEPESTSTTTTITTTPIGQEETNGKSIIDDDGDKKKKKKTEKGKKVELADEAENMLGDKRRRPATIEMDSATIEKARELVTQAKELQKKRDRKRRKKNKTT